MLYHLHRPLTRNRFTRWWIAAVVVLLMGVTAVILLALYTKERAIQSAANPTGSSVSPSILPFPIGVDPDAKRIVEQTDVDVFFSRNLASAQRIRVSGNSWWSRITRELARAPWWQSLASPSSRILVIWPGERREEIAYNIASILRWSDEEQATFLALMASSSAPLTEGVFYPGTYVVSVEAAPAAVAAQITERFRQEIRNRYPDSTAEKVSLRDALTIASLLERESYDFFEMREIAGVIWNRLFIDMPLQLDASLQYVRGTTHAYTWWPKVRPQDKFLESPYNTYENTGLPPGPISNPSAASVLAALNPRETDCFFYFHADDGTFYCSETYAEHVENLENVFGQGR